jgi:hypothetical protein
MSVKRVNGLAVPTPPLAHRYVMDAALISVHDGDTATLRLRLPFREAYEGRCRFARINCPELTAPGGPEARDFAAAWFAEAMAATLPAVERDYPLFVQGRNGDNYRPPTCWRFSESVTATTSATTSSPRGTPSRTR